MPKTKNKEKISYIFNHFGYKNQVLKINEESKELQEALIESYKEPTKQNIEHVAEEIADVMVVIQQFKQHFKLSDNKIKELVDYKIQRTVNRIKSGYDKYQHNERM